MVFNSILFIFILLPVCLTGYYLINHFNVLNGGGAKYWLIIISLCFYGWYDLRLLLWICGSIFFNLLFLGMKTRLGRVSLIAGVVCNLFFLFYGRSMSTVALLGVSFFSFQQISFLIDDFREETGPYSTSDYILFVLYFPKLLQGPIALHNELLPQLQHLNQNRLQAEPFYRGLILFTLGLAKKVLLAQTLGEAVNYGYENLSVLHTADMLIIILSYSLQLYFDFSGYCDMAMGISRMLGIELPVNFDSPYRSGTIIQFWKSWHMTLTRFLTRYVYIPLGGSRRGEIRTYLHLLLVFLISGLWHGTGLLFVIWGLLHGLLYVFTRMAQTHRRGKVAADSGKSVRIMLHAVRKIVGTAATFVYVSVAWIFFRSPTMEQAFSVIRTTAAFQWQLIDRSLAACFNREEFWYIIKVLRLDRWQYAHYLLTFLFLAVSMLIIFFGKNALRLAADMKPCATKTLGIAALFVWCILSLSGVSTYIYLNF